MKAKPLPFCLSPLCGRDFDIIAHPINCMEDNQPTPEQPNDQIDELLEKMKPASADATAEHEEGLPATDAKDLEIEALQKQREEWKDKYIRLFADFDNAKKRMAKDRIELMDMAGKEVIMNLLPVLDDFERALKSAGMAPETAAMREGVQLIFTKLQHLLAARGLKAMESVGKDFDPDLHSAITEIPAPTPELAGKVIDEVEKGYYLNEKIIRHAKVVVGK